VSGDTQIAKTTRAGGLELEVTFTIKGDDAVWFWVWAYICGLDPHVLAWIACGEYVERINKNDTAKKVKRIYEKYHREGHEPL